MTELRFSCQQRTDTRVARLSMLCICVVCGSDIPYISADRPKSILYVQSHILFCFNAFHHHNLPRRSLCLARHHHFTTHYLFHTGTSAQCVYVSVCVCINSRIIIFLCASRFVGTLCVHLHVPYIPSAHSICLLLSQCMGSSFSVRLRKFSSYNVRYWCMMLGLALARVNLE